MKILRVLSAVSAVVLIAVALNACVGHPTISITARNDKTIDSVPVSRTLSGSYLAGRYAQHMQDWRAAGKYMNDVLSYDETNTTLQQRAFLLSLGAKDYKQARSLAERVIKTGDGDEMAIIYMACDEIALGHYQPAIDILKQLPDDGFGQYTKPLLTAWALAGEGKYDESLKLLAENSSNPDDPTYSLHAGMINEMKGDIPAAEKEFKNVMSLGLSLHSAVLIADFFARHNQTDIAKNLYTGIGRLYPNNPFINAIGKISGQVNYKNTDAKGGVSFAMFDLASLLFERKAYDSAQIYASMVQHLTPESPFASLMLGDIAAYNEQYDQAIENYSAITAKYSLFWLSRMRIAEVMELTDNTAGAIKLLTQLSTQPETKLQAFISLGDIYRRNEQFDKALKAYDEALNEIPELTPEHWPLIYARGMSLERLNNWKLAEKDLLTALSLQPDNPQILNFIGYSWANQGVHMDKALGYLRKAVALRPDDGYILDSYGWALYRSGDSKESLKWMEQAVQQVPEDETILDHLGDVYWSLGRKSEALFKWNRSKELSKDSAFRTILQQKIEHGIPAKTHAKPLQKEARL